MAGNAARGRRRARPGRGYRPQMEADSPRMAPQRRRRRHGAPQALSKLLLAGNAASEVRQDMSARLAAGGQRRPRRTFNPTAFAPSTAPHAGMRSIVRGGVWWMDDGEVEGRFVVKRDAAWFDFLMMMVMAYVQVCGEWGPIRGVGDCGSPAGHWPAIKSEGEDAIADGRLCRFIPN
jgi:hypothetical protein